MNITLRCSLIGESGVGKTSFVSSFINKEVLSKYIPITIGVEFNSKSMIIENNVVKLIIWDTAGLERFRSITRAYYIKSNIFLIFYDITNKKSFENINYWYNEIIKLCLEDKVIMLIGNKSDLSNRAVEFEDGLKFAEERSIFFEETNVNEIDKINTIIEKMVKEFIKKYKATNRNLEISGNYELSNKKSYKKSIKKYCCFF